MEENIKFLLDKCNELEKQINKLNEIDQYLKEINERLSNSHICLFYNSDAYKNSLESSQYTGIKGLHFFPLNSKKIKIINDKLEPNNVNYQLIGLFYQLKTLKIINPPLYEIKGINSKSLEYLKIINLPCMYSFKWLEDIPNLNELYIDNTNVGFSNPLNIDIYYFKHKIKKLSFISCKINNLNDLVDYCKENNIYLVIS